MYSLKNSKSIVNIVFFFSDRIAVHPLKDDLPLSAFTLIDDLSER